MVDRYALSTFGEGRFSTDRIKDDRLEIVSGRNDLLRRSQQSSERVGAVYCAGTGGVVEDVVGIEQGLTAQSSPSLANASLSQTIGSSSFLSIAQ